MPATATDTAKPNGAKQAAPTPRRPFRAGVQSLEDAQYDNSFQLVASTHDMPDFALNGDGFLRRVWVQFDALTSANAATVTFAQDGPFNVIDTIVFLDTSQRPVYGPFNGITAFSTNKWGGYFNQNDPRRDPSFSATTGAGGTGGSFTFILQIPLEIAARDCLGSLVNKNTAVPYKVKLRLSASATPYGTPPTTAANVRVRMIQDNWWEPEGTDMKGHPLAPKPPAVNTTQFWASNNYQLGGALANIPGLQLSTGLGYPFRNLILVLMDSLNSRSAGDAAWPDPVTFTVEKNQLFVRNKELWITRLAKAFDLKSATADTADARDNGTFPIWFNDDFGPQPGNELRNGYLATRGGQNMLLTGVLGSGGTPPYTLYTYVNWVAPANGDPASLTAYGAR